VRKKDLADAIKTAREMAALNRADADDQDYDERDRYGAAQAAFGQDCVIRVFTDLLESGR